MKKRIQWSNPIVDANLKKVKDLLSKYSTTRVCKIIEQDHHVHWKKVYRHLRAHRLKGIPMKKAISINWTSDMLRILKKGFKDRFTVDLAIELRMSKRSVARKARELGLRKSKKFMTAHRDRIRRNFTSKKITKDDLTNPY